MVTNFGHIAVRVSKHLSRSSKIHEKSQPNINNNNNNNNNNNSHSNNDVNTVKK